MIKSMMIRFKFEPIRKSNLFNTEKKETIIKHSLLFFLLVNEIKKLNEILNLQPDVFDRFRSIHVLM